MLEGIVSLKGKMATDRELIKHKKHNYLYFTKRWRSRSFYSVEELAKEETAEPIEEENDNFYGYGLSGQRFEFNPKEYAIIKKYSEKLKLFEDLLSPTLVTLVSCVETNKVRFQLGFGFDYISFSLWYLNGSILSKPN